MRKSQVEIGGIYAANVSGQIAPVRLYAAHHLGGWYGTNCVTGCEVRIKSAARLRYPMHLCPRCGGFTARIRPDSLMCGACILEANP